MGILDYFFNNHLDMVCMQLLLTMCLNIFILPYKRFNIQIILISFIAAILISMLYVPLGLITVSINWLFIVTLNIYITRKMDVSLTIASLSVLLLILSDYITTITSLHIKHLAITSASDNIQLYEHLFISFIIASLLGIIISFARDKFLKKISMNKSMRWIGTGITVFTFISYYVDILFERFSGEADTVEEVNAILFLIYALISITIYMVLIYIMQKDIENKQKKKELEYMQNYTSQLEKNYNEMRKFKHDYQNILTSLESYMNDGDLLGLKDYYYQNVKPTSNIISTNTFKLSQLSNLKVKEIKSIIASKLLYSQELGIDTEFEEKEIIEKINMNPIILVRSLGILLDNAIEEVQKNKSGKIRVGIIKRESSIIIVISNSCSSDIPKLHEMQKMGFSTKDASRGMGLSNLKEMIGPLNKVTLETVIERNMFIQILEISN
ncbi:hypothetical protein COL26_21580 [Bacillus thuringiensis]|uniref:Sensor histidine kinase NatK-like C-terminal domain-containing protein n=1 Tax=Bacillus thuringiensis TaxID=1428 RepID=A0ABD6S1V0_BACTU|nr:GHKL domain-containing protein [Bacillus thuringiensis]PER42605.1 hypothetical protein CN495_32520 [Bacillus thuringiensis]PEU82507.1 hypothetical protein CN411_23835 [Bacillus thuringiensis]PFI11242.1 hypothetical protein COI79_06010 [Bacillus thuringiensis]PFN36596.1 hypothetical protein COJ56_23525 [Bacillus thuringiensis]PFW34679.1 hypothetical protein COL26_21580 [Bacillus thuringiensis]